MKRVLIISYYWQPAGGPGSQRIVKFSKYLQRFGWEPLILTVQNGEFPYIDNSLSRDVPEQLKINRTRSIEPFRLYKKLTNRTDKDSLPVGLLTMKQKSITGKLTAWIRANLFVPDARIGWIPFAVRAGMDIIREQKIDCIFTSSPPHSLQLCGQILKKRTGIPWVADLRDPWTGIRYYKTTSRGKLVQAIDEWFEKAVLKQADRIVTVSESLVSEFATRIEDESTDKFLVLPNGYDEDDFKDIESETTDKFTLLHSGNLSAQQNPCILFKSLRRLIENKPGFGENLLLKFIGRIHPEVAESLHTFGLERYISIQSFIPHEDIIKEMVNASVLLMVVPDIAENAGIVTGKLFEYIGSGKPVLVIGPPEGDAGRIISQAGNSKICNYEDEQSCIDFLISMYETWMSGNVPENSAQFREPFSRENLTRKLADVFDSVIEDKRK
ncbi:glycosyltransferase [candidate division KSB1 bacterium]|nr:glycosyltransferase [candidate division KSB1 bacterium]